MSRWAREQAFEFAAGVSAAAGLTKDSSAAAVDVVTLQSIVLPLYEQIGDRDRQIKALLAREKEIARLDKMCRVLSAPPPVTLPARSPMCLPQQPEHVDLVPGQWQTPLVPAGQPVRNGHHHEAAGDLA